MNQSVSEARRSAGQKSSHVSLQTCAFCRVHTYAQSRHDGSHFVLFIAKEDGAFSPALDTAGYMWLKMCELHGWHTPISHNVEISGRFLMCWHIWVCQLVCALWQWVASRITLPAGWILSLIQFEDFGEQVNKPRFPLVLRETAGTGARHHF